MHWNIRSRTDGEAQRQSTSPVLLSSVHFLAPHSSGLERSAASCLKFHQSDSTPHVRHTANTKANSSDSSS